MSHYKFDELDETWDSTEEYWWIDAAPVLEEIIGTGLDYYDAYEKLDEKKKRKIIRLILHINDIKIVEEKEVKDYKVTVDDINMVMEMFKEYKENKKKVIITNVEVR